MMEMENFEIMQGLNEELVEPQLGWQRTRATTLQQPIQE